MFPEYPTKDRTDKQQKQKQFSIFYWLSVQCLLYQRIGTEYDMENRFCTCNPLLSMLIVALFFYLYIQKNAHLE